MTGTLILHGSIRAQTTIDFFVPANTTKSIFMNTGLHATDFVTGD